MSVVAESLLKVIVSEEDCKDNPVKNLQSLFCLDGRYRGSCQFQRCVEFHVLSHPMPAEKEGASHASCADLRSGKHDATRRNQ
jgi:hypothetical protein